MTREDAIYEIKQLAVLSNEKNIERITEALEMAIEALQNADRKTEPSDYCKRCTNNGDHDGECSNCVSDSEVIKWKMPSHYKPKDEPQTETSTNSEKVQLTDEPQTDCGDFADRLAYERGVKHAWEVAKKVFDSTVTFYEAEDVAKQMSKDEPQTDCPYIEYPCHVCDLNTDCPWK